MDNFEAWKQFMENTDDYIPKDVSYKYNSDGTVEVNRTMVSKSNNSQLFYEDPEPFFDQNIIDDLINKMSRNVITNKNPLIVNADPIGTDYYDRLKPNDNDRLTIDLKDAINFCTYYILYDLVDLGDGICEENILTVTPYKNIAEDIHKKYGYLIREENIV